MSYLRNLCEGGGGFAPSSVQHILTIWVTWWLFYERHEPPSSTAGFTPGFMRGMSPLPFVDGWVHPWFYERHEPLTFRRRLVHPWFYERHEPLTFRRRLGSPLVLWEAWAPYLSSTAGFTPGFMRGMSPLRRRLGSPLVFGGICVAHRFGFLTCVFLFVMILVCPTLPVFPDCPFLLAPSVFSNVCLS